MPPCVAWCRMPMPPWWTWWRCGTCDDDGSCRAWMEKLAMVSGQQGDPPREPTICPCPRVIRVHGCGVLTGINGFSLTCLAVLEHSASLSLTCRLASGVRLFGVDLYCCICVLLSPMRMKPPLLE